MIIATATVFAVLFFILFYLIANIKKTLKAVEGKAHVHAASKAKKKTAPKKKTAKKKTAAKK